MLSVTPEKKNKGQANDADAHVGRRIRQRRVWLDMTQAALGAAIGVSFQQIQKYEKGTNRVSASRLQELANALDVKPSYFFEGLPDENKSGERADAKNLDLPPEVVEFVSSEEGLEIIRALTRIGDLKVRNRVAMLIKSLGEHDW
ncbi:helix-turn-helix domain-containing protein [Ensifer sp. P24N7]|uniref:helix-turn-helix domain-containing protein n=1 Tax=Sinorhizobium sp. P24N7 TaxID=3348358 RepID=UPI0035F2ADB4